MYYELKVVDKFHIPREVGGLLIISTTLYYYCYYHYYCHYYYCHHYSNVKFTYGTYLRTICIVSWNETFVIKQGLVIAGCL